MGDQDAVLSALIMPRETPVPEIVVKRALLFYDAVLLPDPREDHLIPNEAIVDKYPTMEITLAAFAPYARVEDYNSVMEQLLEKCSRLIRGNLVKVVNPDRIPQFPHRLVRHVYHCLAGDTRLLKTASESIEDRVPLRNGIYYGLALAPGYPNPYSSYPPPAQLEDCHLTSLSMLRIGQVLKYTILAGREDAIPVALDVGQSKIIDHISDRASVPHDSLRNLSIREELGISVTKALDLFVWEELIDQSCLAEMSFREIESLRSRTWGGLQRVRSKLLKECHRARIGLASASPKETQDFMSGKLLEMLDGYHKAQAEYLDELRAKGIWLTLAVGGSAAGYLSTRLIPAPGWGSVISLASAILPSIISMSGAHLGELWKREKSYHKAPLYSLMRGLTKKTIQRED